MAPPLANNNDLNSIGGGAGAESTDDPAAYFYQDTGIVYRKVTATAAGGAGFGYTHGSTFDMTAAATRTMMMKFIVTDFGGLNATEGVTLRLGSSTTAYHLIPVTGSDVAGTPLDLYPAKGGFIILPVDPNIAAYIISTNGSPALASTDYFGITARFASASAKSENLGLDAIDLGVGLELHTGGVLKDFVDHDEGITTNRFGYATQAAAGVYNIFGTLFIARNAGSSAAITMNDATRDSWLFPDGLFAAEWSGFLLDLNSVSAIIAIQNKTLTGLGSTALIDTRPVFKAIGVAGTSILVNLTFTNFAKITLTSAVTARDWIVIDSDQIIQDGAIIERATIDNSAVGTGVAAILSDDVEDITDSHFISSNVGHAVELTSNHTTPVQWDGNTLSGYAGTVGDNLVPNSGSLDAAIYNNSGKALEIQVVNGANSPSVRNGAGATTTVVAGLINLTVTVLDDETGLPISTARVWLGRKSDKSELINGQVNASGVITASIPYDSDTDVLGWAREQNLTPPDYTQKNISGQYTTAGFSVTVRLLPNE
ncbi:MAG: hypothetical protein DRH08_01025 [Deltaproteobacteria bacterium]|nr:MAG: hypothetical protein DRH08_01025 [Deltaproteobacteria bacterium]